MIKRTTFFISFLIVCMQSVSTTAYGQGYYRRQQQSEPVTQKSTGTVKKNPQVTVTSGEYVDLGLPSGTLWATKNIGANKPEEYGDYFAWGETKGYNSGKRDFSWSTYKWCNGTGEKLTKYCVSSYRNNGFVDNKTELDLEDDAAYVNWGNQWRMPNKEQLEELYMNCRWILTNYRGVKGYIVKGKNGKSIFLPGAGACIEAHVPSDYRDWLYLWTRTLYENDTKVAYALEYGFQVSKWMHRCRGLSIRPVRLKER